MPVGLLQIDTERDVVYNNACLLEILYGSEPLESTISSEPASVVAAEREDAEDSQSPAPTVNALLQTLTPASVAEFDRVLDEVLGQGVDRDVEVDIVHPSGAWHGALMNIRALRRASGEVAGAITCVLDITDRARARQELEHRATYDTLTHVHNRASILALLQEQLDRGDGKRTGVVYVDLDKFKPVNDTFGHAAGDELLVLVADRLKLASRDSDVIGRLGGDEFLIVLRDVPSEAVAMQIAERIAMTVCGSFALSNGEADLRASIGVACGVHGTVTADELVRRADAAMYRSKSDGQSVPVLAAA